VQHLADALLELVGADGIRHREFRPAPPRACNDHGDHNQQDEDQDAEADQRVDRAHRPVASHENDLVHACPSSRFGCWHERIANIHGKCPVNFYG
jgi:hypothetical protein